MRKLKVLPPMKCDSGCGECCGIVPATETEFQRVLRYAREHGIEPVEQGVTCPWFQGGRCAVYPERPLVCRLFGHTEGMPCPKGYNTNVPERDVHRMIRANGKTNRLLHEALPDSPLLTELRKHLDQPESYALLTPA